MFKYIPKEEQVPELRKQNARLVAENATLAANLDYIAMLSNIDIDDNGGNIADEFNDDGVIIAEEVKNNG